MRNAEFRRPSRTRSRNRATYLRVPGKRCRLPTSPSPLVSGSTPLAAGRKLGLFSSSIPPWFVLSQNMLLINTTSNWLCSGAFLGMLMPPDWVAVSFPLVGQDSHLVVRRILDDTLEILFHASAQCQRRHRLAAYTLMAATQVHLAQAIHHGALATCHPPYPTPSSATRNWVRFACVICCDLLRFPGFLAPWGQTLLLVIGPLGSDVVISYWPLGVRRCY